MPPGRPPKKRLRLSVRPRTSESNKSNSSSNSSGSATIAVAASARPRRAAAQNKRYSTQDGNADSSSDDCSASGLSSAPSPPAGGHRANSVTSKTPSSAKADYGAMFMAAYLEADPNDGGIDEDEDKTGRRSELLRSPADVQPQASTQLSSRKNSRRRNNSTPQTSALKKSQAPIQAGTSAAQPLPQAAEQNAGPLHGLPTPRPPESHNEQVIQPRPTSSSPLHHEMPRLRRPVPPTPLQLPLSASDFMSTKEMVRRLKALHVALAPFGGPPPRLSPSDSDDEDIEENKLNGSNPLDLFLSVFDADDDYDDDSDISGEVKDRVVGLPDQALAFGINFIVNALRSWASQRIEIQIRAAQRNPEALAEWEAMRRRRPGRPRKPGSEEIEGDPLSIRLDEFGQYDLTGYPEGAAIKAFTDVVESGALQMNTVAPRPLARSLRKLYKQIDGLINQRGATEKPWQMMSYHAQIQAQAELVEHVKMHQFQAQQLMAQSQLDNQRKILEGMGLTFPPTMPIANQALRKDDHERQRHVEIEQKRNLQQSRQQPYLTKQHMNPMFPRSPPFQAGPMPLMSQSAPPGVPTSGVLGLSSTEASPPNNGGHSHASQHQPDPAAIHALAAAHVGIAMPYTQNPRDGTAGKCLERSRRSSDASNSSQRRFKQQSAQANNSAANPITIQSSPVNRSRTMEPRGSGTDAHSPMQPAIVPSVEAPPSKSAAAISHMGAEYSANGPSSASGLSRCSAVSGCSDNKDKQQSTDMQASEVVAIDD